MKPKMYVADLAIYEHKVVCFVTRDPIALQEAFDLLKIDHTFSVGKNADKIMSGDGGLCYYGPRNLTAIWLGKQPRKPNEISVLVHECIHAGVQLLHMVGVPVDAKTDEALTYVVGHLVNQFLAQMRKK